MEHKRRSPNCRNITRRKSIPGGLPHWDVSLVTVIQRTSRLSGNVGTWWERHSGTLDRFVR